MRLLVLTQQDLYQSFWINLKFSFKIDRELIPSLKIKSTILKLGINSELLLI